VPKVKYSFKSIGELGDLQKDEVCGEWPEVRLRPELTTDVIGIVKEVHELGSVTSKATQKPVSRFQWQDIS